MFIKNPYFSSFYVQTLRHWVYNKMCTPSILFDDLLLCSQKDEVRISFKRSFCWGEGGGGAWSVMVQSSKYILVRKMLRLEIFLSNNLWWSIYATYSEQPEYLHNFHQQKISTHHPVISSQSRQKFRAAPFIYFMSALWSGQWSPRL